MAEGERRVRAFAIKVAKALREAEAPPSPIHRTERIEYKTRTGLFQTETRSELRSVETAKGWEVWTQKTREVIWKVVDYRGRTDHRAAGLIERSTKLAWLASDGAILFGEMTHNSNYLERPPFDNRWIDVHLITAEEIGLIDAKWYRQFVRSPKAHEWVDYYSGQPRYDSPGVGLSIALRRLADSHGVLPRRPRA